MYMDYTRIYNQLIGRAKKRKEVKGYTENHHIIPRSEGGNDLSENLVKLTGREHFIAHKLLWMENPSFSRCAAYMMMSNHRGIKWGKVYSLGRKQFNESPNHPLRNADTRSKQLEAVMGKPKSDEHKKKISEANKGKPKSKEHVAKMKANLPDRSGISNSMYGKGKVVIIDGVEYINLRAAVKSIGNCWETITRKLKSDEFPNYKYKNK